MRSPFLSHVRDVIRSRYYSIRTEDTYLYWINYFILYHDKRHPQEMGHEHIRDFLNFLALQRNVAAATQKTALNALVFLYRQVLNQNLGDCSDFYRARAPKKLPVVRRQLSWPVGDNYDGRLGVLCFIAFF